MSYLGNLMAEQETDDYLMSLGDGERRELMEDNIAYKYVDSEVTRAFDMLDRKENNDKK